MESYYKNIFIRLSNKNNFFLNVKLFFDVNKSFVEMIIFFIDISFFSRRNKVLLKFLKIFLF